MKVPTTTSVVGKIERDVWTLFACSSMNNGTYILRLLPPVTTIMVVGAQEWLKMETVNSIKEYFRAV